MANREEVKSGVADIYSLLAIRYSLFAGVAG
jgi:hypothetical protein